MPARTTPPPANNFNNPTKEIWASSGVFSGRPFSSQPYANDFPNTNIPNTGINTTTTSSTTPPPSDPRQNALFYSQLSSGNYFIDDMLIFNKYIHYASQNTVITFNPQVFLEQAIVNFNVYSLEYR